MRPGRAPGRRSGFSLVELMIAMAVTIALSAGMLTMLMSTRSGSLTQSALEQVQEDQRLVLTRLIDTVQNAGYVPNPSTAAASLQLVAAAPFANAGQSVYGTSGGAAPGDTLVVRYQAGTSDGVMDCSGSTNTSGARQIMVNSFSVDAAGNLDCTVNGRVMPLAAGVSNFTVSYGVDTNGDGAADWYATAANIGATSATWLSVMSVRVTITFANPLAGQPGQPATLPPVTQVIPVLNQL